MKGEGNSVDFGARIYDSRLNRFLSVDPLRSKFPNWSPYNFAINNPIYFIDIDGRDVGVYVTAKPVGTTMINLYSAGEIKKNPALKTKTIEVPVYEVNIRNESGSTATYYFTRTNFRGREKNVIENVTFNVRKDGDEFNAVIKSRWGGKDNVLELRDINDINNQTILGMKGDKEASRTAIQFHVKGASDGCLLCVGSEQFVSTDEDVKLDKSNLSPSSKGSQANFMKTIKDFQKEDVENKYDDKIKVKFEKDKSSVKKK